MVRDWESVFVSWSQGPSQTEQEKADNAISQIRQAIMADPKLNTRDIEFFVQGSYRNRVNVKKDSDVDIGVLCKDTYFPEYPDENVKAVLASSTSPATYDYQQFRNELENALVSRFGRAYVQRGDKAFNIRENTYRVEADVVAFFEHRRYNTSTNVDYGVQMLPDKRPPYSIINWPGQHYTNGENKNTRTGRKYKRTVRIIKSLSNEMSDKGINSAKQMPSFLIECLAWNTPDNLFMDSSYKTIVKNVLVHLYDKTKSQESCNEWGEVSELKYLFRSSQPWTREQAKAFVVDAWNYVGYQ